MNNYWLNRKKLPTWDFRTELGEAIKEKYSNWYVTVVEISNLINRKTIEKDKNE